MKTDNRVASKTQQLHQEERLRKTDVATEKEPIITTSKFHLR
jgi:hypothetical protein